MCLQTQFFVKLYLQNADSKSGPNFQCVAWHTIHQRWWVSFILYFPILTSQTEQYSELPKLITRPYFIHPINPCVPTAIHIIDVMFTFNTFREWINFNSSHQAISSERLITLIPNSFIAKDWLGHFHHKAHHFFFSNALELMLRYRQTEETEDCSL